MLDALRKSTNSWIALIPIGLLVMSFAVWGIADIFRGYGGDVLAKVGKHEISTEEFRRTFQNELRVLSRQTGQTLSNEQARALGIDTRILSFLVGGAALDNQADTLQLGISEKAIRDNILRSREFQTQDGTFSKLNFEELLRQNGFTEQGYVARQRRGSVRRQLTGTILGDVTVPKPLIEIVNRFSNDTRVLKYIILPRSSAGKIPKPTVKQLDDYYSSQKRRYTAPEYRKLTILSLTPDSIKSNIEIADTDVKAAYESRIGDFTKPEKRQIQQITYLDKKSADAAYRNIKDEKTFVAAAKDRGYKEAEIDLGLIAESDMADKEIGKAAFALKAGEISTPVVGKLATVILRVGKVEPAVTQTFDEVKKKLRDDLARARAGDEITDLHDKIEDDRAGGATLIEIANKLSLKAVSIENVDRQGLGPDGKKPAGLPVAPRVLAAAFSSDVGVENDPIEMSDQGLVWLNVEGVTPDALKPFDKVKSQVIKDWSSDEVRRKLSKLTTALIKRINEGEGLKKIAGELKLAVKTSKALKRAGRSDNLPATAIQQAFVLPQGGAGAVFFSGDKGRAVFVVDKINKPEALDTERTKRLTEIFSSQIAGDYLSEFVAGLRDQYGVTTNQNAFNALTGRQ